MKKLHSIVALTAICCSLFSGLQSAPITYTFVDNAAFQSGHTLSGSITTDGTIGNLANQNILNWNWTITNTATSAVLSTGDNSNPLESDTQVGLASASATQITMMQPQGTNGSNAALSLFGQLGYVMWQRISAGNALSPLPVDRYLAEYFAADGNTDNGGMRWNNRAEGNTLSLASNPDGGWVIAEVSAVPELSTYCLIFSGLTLALVSVRRRNIKQA